MSAASVVTLGQGLAGRLAPGPGAKVLWLHGYTLDSSVWQELWALLPEWSHIGLDLPGHGASQPMTADEDLPALARRIATLALKYEARHLIALSFGALVALQVAIEQPDFFRTLILGAPPLGGGPQELAVGVRFEELKRLWAANGSRPAMRKLWMTSPPNIFAGAEKRVRLWADLCRLVERHPWLELSDHSMELLGNHVQREAELRRIRAAVLLVLGEDEMNAFKRCAELIRRAVPDCKRSYLPDAGHLCLLEDPQAVQLMIREHLAAHTN